MVDRLSAEIQDMEAAIKKPRKAAGKGQAEQTLLRRALKRAIPVKNKSDRKKAMESPIYKELRVKRDENRVRRKNLLEMENKLRAKRRELYYYSKLNDVPEKSKIYKAPATTPSNATVFRTNPTWNHFTGEEAVEHLDIKDLIQNCRNGERTVVFAGTDYGLCKMSETIALTRTQLEEHINYYSILLGDTPSSAPRESESEASSSSVRAASSSSSQKPKVSRILCSNKITAPHVNDVSRSQRMGKRREKRLRKGAQEVRDAMDKVTDKNNSLNRVTTLEEVDAAYKVRSDNKTRTTLRAFEHSKARMKDLHTQKLRTSRSWNKLGASERRFVQKVGHDEEQ
ncbi:hypothetical protein BG011_002070, partial [Mortierella polycephala]